MCSDSGDELRRPQPRKHIHASPAPPSAGGHTKYFRRNSNQFPSIASKKLTASKGSAGGRRQKLPIQDSASGDDARVLMTTLNSLCESLIFSVCVDAAGYRSIQLRRGVDAIRGQQEACDNHRDTMGALKVQVLPSQKGVCVVHVRWTPCRLSPPGVALLCRRGLADFQLRPVELPLLACPKGCFTSYDVRSIDKLSGRTAG